MRASLLLVAGRCIQAGAVAPFGIQLDAIGRIGQRTNEANCAIGVVPATGWEEMPLGGAPPLGSGQWIRAWRAVEFQDRVDSTWPDPVGGCRLLGADGEFALVFAFAEFALNGERRRPRRPWAIRSRRSFHRCVTAKIMLRNSPSHSKSPA